MFKLFLRYKWSLYWVGLFCYLFPLPVWAWGFFVHKQINRYAITTLPPGMFRFYKAHLSYLTSRSVNPDKRRYRVKNESAKHFIDLEFYAIAAKQKMPLQQAIAHYGADAVVEHGQLPWVVLEVHRQLTQAFRDKDLPNILKYAADLGHYVADAHVPLHTTANYDGQMTGQEGIHALWETRLPFLFFDSYKLWVGKAHYIENPLAHIWDIVLASHDCVHTLLALEKKLKAQYPAWLQYSFEQEGVIFKKQYAVAFATRYHQALQGQVEARLRQSIVEVGNFWVTAWLDAGAPNLDDYV